MNRFDNKGMMLFPEPMDHINVRDGKVLVTTEVYCANGHNLINGRAMFNGHPGIVLQVTQGGKTGKLALSPIVGDKARICLDIDLVDGQTVTLACPECGVELPVHSPCDACDGNLVALFLTPEANFNDCIAVCNKIGCPKANILSSGQVIAISHLEIT